MIIGISCNGNYGMFVIKYVEYLMHDYSFNSLTGAHMDWFWDQMLVELLYMKDLPI